MTRPTKFFSLETLIAGLFLLLVSFAGLQSFQRKTPGATISQSGPDLSADIKLSNDPAWASDIRDERFTYGLNVQSPWKDGGKLFLLFPEHLEYNPVGNTILRHYDKLPLPWVFSPGGKMASYRVESLALKNVFVESTARVLTEHELPFDAAGLKLSMRIINNGTKTLPVIRPLICMQYKGLTGFPGVRQDNFKHNFIIVDGKITSLADLPTENANTTFKGCVVKGCPQNDTRSEKVGGLIKKNMDLALSIVTSKDNKRKVIIWWTPGKSMIANARIPCLHADPYFGTLKPGEEAFAHGYIVFTEGNVEPIVSFLEKMDKKVF